MKLYLNDKEYEVKLKNFISPNLKGEGLEILKQIDDLDPQYKFQRRMIEIVRDAIGQDASDYGADYQKLLEDGKLSKEQVKEMTDLSMEVSRLHPEIEKQKDQLRIRLFKLYVDYKNIPSEIKEVWDKEEFWNEQDIIGIGEIINSFRSLVTK